MWLSTTTDDEPRAITLINLDGANTISVLMVIVGLLFVITFTTYIFVHALQRAAHQPAPTSLVTAISLLALIALFGVAFTRNESLETISAAAIGALAGALSTTFARQNDEEPE